MNSTEHLSSVLLGKESKENKMSPLQEYIHDNRLCLYCEVTAPKGDYTEVVSDLYWNNKNYKEAVVARHYPSGYLAVTCYISRNTANRAKFASIIYYAALKLMYLNGTDKLDVIYGYLDLVCRDKFDDGDLTFDRDRLWNIVEEASTVKIDVKQISELRKYKWLGIFEMIPAKVKSSIVMKNTNMTKSQETNRAIEAAVEELLGGSDFITASNIAEVSNKSLSTVKRHIVQFRDEMDSHNIAISGTANFKTYIKELNISSIVDAIHSLHEAGSRLSKTDLADELELSRMTLHRLWSDERIQKAMNQYNQQQ